MANGKLQKQDFKTEAELLAAGASSSDLVDDSLIYVTGNGLNKTFKQAVVDGDFAGGGGGGGATSGSSGIQDFYEAATTVAQSSITLPFSVAQNASGLENFFLYIDGKLLREGAGNDYTFSDATTIALNQTFTDGVNILAYTIAQAAVDSPGIENFYKAESTAAQTSVNFGFDVADSVLSKQSFFLVVNGKILTEGASYDYVFDAGDPTQTLTLNQPLEAGWNVQAFIIAGVTGPAGAGGTASGGGDISQIKSYKANDDGVTDWIITSADSVLPDFSATDTLAASFGASSVGNALLSNDSADAVYEFASAVDSQYDAIGFSLNIPAYARGRDLGYSFQYRTADVSGDSADADWMVWVYDSSNGAITTAVSTGAQSAGTSIEVASSTGMSVGQKIWIGETGSTTQVTESHITAIADSTHVTLADAVTLSSGDNFITGILTDVFTTINAKDSDTDKEGATFKLQFLPPSDCSNVKVMLQQLTSETDATLFTDAHEISSDPFKSISTQAAPEMIRLHTGNGHGLTNTKIRRFSTTVTDTSNKAITYTDSATDGASFTINETGVYSISYHDYSTTGASRFGISVNSSQLTSDLDAITEADRLASEVTDTATRESTMAWTGILNVGDIVRPHTNGNPNATTRVQFTITAQPLANDSVITSSSANKDSMVRVSNDNGYGSSSTKIPRFTNTYTDTGSAITYLDSPTLGSTFTINETGTYSITFNGNSDGSESLGITLNSSQLTTDVDSVDSADLLTYNSSPNSGWSLQVSWTGILNAGDIIRPHTRGGLLGNGSSFTITKIGVPSASVLNAFPTITVGQEPEAYIASDAALYASSNTALPYFQTVTQNTISNLGTITNDSTSGCIFIATQRCKVTMTHRNAFTAAGSVGISKNASDSDLDTGIYSVTEGNVVALAITDTADRGSSATFQGILEPGDFLAAHCDKGKTASTAAQLQGVTILAEPIHGQTNQAAIISQPVAYVKDLKTSGTAGGSSSANTVHTRDLNTLSGDIAAVGVSLSSNQFTLPAGKYEIDAVAPTHRTNRNQVFLYNVTDSVYSIDGKSSYHDSANNVTGVSTLEGSVYITSSKTYELRHWTMTAQTSDGLGVESNGTNNPQTTEVYTTVKITRKK